MVKVEVLTLTSTVQLINVNGLYCLGYAWLFGMSIWVSFFGGIIAFRSLPRQQFGVLQHKTFPVYFVISMIISFGLMATWISNHPDVIQHIGRPSLPVVAQFYSLLCVFVSQATNYLVIGPLISKIMFHRFKLEKEEGKSYGDPGVSENMKILNRRFGMLHGVGSLANLFTVIALAFHGLWIGNSVAMGY